MTNYWKYIEERLHEESNLHYPNNNIKLILETYLNGILNKFYEESIDLLKNSFLLTMTGKHLDLKGEEYGIKRDVDESDDEYRQRLFNVVLEYLSVNFIKMQKTLVFTKKSVDDNIREKMTSNNPYLNNEYAVIPPNDDISNFLKNDVIYEDVYQIYVKGW